jgi:hypothetical protein
MSTSAMSFSTEFMQNYKQAELMSPEKKFEALQTNMGCSLLFSIGTDNAFYVTLEDIGHNTGWQKYDLSSTQIKNSFPNTTGYTCKTFDVAQSVVDGSIGLAMVINDGKFDHLFLSLGNSNSNTDWIKNPTWIQCPFDNPAQNVVIAGVFISETANNTQFIVADILRDPNSAEKLILRYYITPGQSPIWNPHDVSIDLEADSYTSCLGRQYLTGSPHQPTIDGLYTSGQVAGNAQLQFQPLFNQFNSQLPATPALLYLPNRLVADTIASCRKSDMSSDLYACSQGGLYYFASSNQTNNSVAVLVAQSDMYKGVKSMYAAQQNNVNIVWGLNGNDEIFYTTCPVGQETNGGWTHSLPIVSNVDLFSPYINVKDGGNTFFVVAESNMKKLIKSTTTGLWSSQSITLPSPNTKDTNKYPSYTTQIQVVDANNQAIPNSPVTISTASRSYFYINHLYYVVDSGGVTVNTDSLGNVTIVEWVNNLVATKLTLKSADGDVQQVNPMDVTMKRNSDLNTPAKLKDAVITNDDGSTKKLISSSVSDPDLAALANANSQTTTIYNTLNTPRTTLNVPMNSAAANAMALAADDSIWVEIGDLFHWLKSGIDAVINFVEDVATGIWHFVATIAGKVYKAVINAVEKVVGAIEWVYNQIKTAIEDVVKFLSFLFGWQDILTTHKVMKNVIIQFVNHQVSNLENVKADISSGINFLINKTDKWANIPNFTQPAGSATQSNKPLAGQNSAPANLGTHHLQGGASGANSAFSPAKIAENIFDDLINAIDQEEETIVNALKAIKTDIIDQFNTLTVTEVIEKIIAILADTVLKSIEIVLTTAIDVFIQVVEGVMGVLTATLDIPVISWLYKEISGEDLSILDVICLVAAIPATIVYKIGSQVAPFSKNDSFTQSLLGATSFSQVQAAFFVPSTPNTRARMALAAANMPVLDQSRLKIFGVVTGFFALAGSVSLIIFTTIQRTLEMLGGSSYTLNSILAFSNIAYISPNIATFVNVQTDNWYQQLNNALTGVSAIKGFVNIALTSLDSSSKAAKISPFIETLINTAWNVPVIMNIVDNHAAATTTYKSLIPESIGNFAFNIGGMMEFPIALINDPKAKAITSLVQFALMLVYGLCMPIAGGIYEWEKNPDQFH